MSSGKSPTRSKKIPLKAVMIYLRHDDADRLAKFAEDRGLSNSKIAREGIIMRMDREGDRFEQGYNEALSDVKKVVKETYGAGMMFPSGKSFAELVCDGIDVMVRPKHE